MRTLRVLVVEDDAMIAVLLVELLTGMGHDVCAIEATEDGAVATAVRCRPDLMIVNAQLDDGSGISAVEEIHRTCSVALVFVSGDIAGVRALMPDAVVIQKPFRELDLSRAIQRALVLQDGQEHKDLTTRVPFTGIDDQPTRVIE